MYPRKNLFTFKTWSVIILSCSVLLTDGCSTLQELAQSIQKPRLSVTDVHVTGYDFNGLDLAFDVKVENPNALSVKMMSFDYNLGINGRTFVNGQQDKETQIKASGESTFQVPVRLGFKDIYSTVENLANSDQADYEFKSTVAFDLPGLGRTEVPVRKEGEIPLLKMPSIRINNLHVNDLSLSKADLTLSLEFDNPNGIGFNIHHFDYNLNINGSQWAEGSALQGIAVPKNDVTTLDIPIKLNIAQMGLSAFKLLSGSQDVNYKLNGDFSLGAVHPLLGDTDFKIDREGRVSLSGGN